MKLSGLRNLIQWKNQHQVLGNWFFLCQNEVKWSKEIETLIFNLDIVWDGVLIEKTMMRWVNIIA